MGTVIRCTGGLATLVAIASQLAACVQPASAELVLKCDGKRVDTYEGAFPFKPTTQDITVVLRFLLPAFALPPSETREPVFVVQEPKGRSLLSAAGSPSSIGKQGSLISSDQELTASADQQARDLNGVMQRDRYRFKVSRLTGDYTASWHFPGSSMIEEEGRCEPFDPAARKF